ncbi:DUF1304 domain-containing protein [Fretibacter rubidus]|uniref:DUF1304 domain-containing protein n=1 Tax=Fretibacter rubidus TaxID=570162 RepID=UPI00352B0F6F
MKTLAIIFTGLVALLHLGFMIVEMFFWTHPIGYAMFNTTEIFAAQTDFMASNQGLYNGFLVAGLGWGLLSKRRDVVIFFLLCVITAGVWGAVTVKPTIFIVQSIPAIIALGLTVLSSRKP